MQYLFYVTHYGKNEDNLLHYNNIRCICKSTIYDLERLLISLSTKRIILLQSLNYKHIVETIVLYQNTSKLKGIMITLYYITLSKQ